MVSGTGLVVMHWEDDRFGAGFHHRNVAFSVTGILFFGTGGTAAAGLARSSARPCTHRSSILDIACSMSALHPKADITENRRRVR
jgi:hypothetical protein